MKKFWRTQEYLRLLQEAAPAEASLELFVTGAWTLSDACDDFVERVREANRGFRAKRERSLRNLEEVLELIGLESGTEALLDETFSRLVSEGAPPEKTLVRMALDGPLDWHDVRRYLARKDLRRAIERLGQPHPKELDEARNFKEPRNDLFLTAFNVWANLKGVNFFDATISDLLETPAQKFIQSATENALQVAGLSYPDGRTVANLIRKRKKTEKENA